MEAVGGTYYTKHAPRSVADVNLCVVGVKNVLSSTSQKGMRKYISKLQKEEVHIFNMSGIGMQASNKKE